MAISRLAQVQTPARDRPRQHSLAHARVEWADGTVREGWLKVGEDGMTVTVGCGGGGRRPTGPWGREEWGIYAR